MKLAQTTIEGAERSDEWNTSDSLCSFLQVPELNVQNGVLKALSFLFEYIGEMGKDYIYAVSPLLEDALIDRDLVHRQTAASVVQHMSLGVAGLGCEDGLTHLLNLVWPNIFEMSPHVVNAVMGAIDGCRLALGPPIILNYTLQVNDILSSLHNSGLHTCVVFSLSKSLVCCLFEQYSILTVCRNWDKVFPMNF